MITQLDGLKQWKCANGHVLGVVERVTYENSLGQTRHVTRLLLFRHAIDVCEEHPAEVEVIGPLEGTMPGIICDVEGCGEVRPWEMGRDAVERLIEKLQKPINHGSRSPDGDGTAPMRLEAARLGGGDGKNDGD
jgi:hypothetical protein